MKVLKKFEFKNTGPGIQAKYDWDLFLDGTARQFTPGEDFTCDPDNFRVMAMGQAKKRGKIAKTAKIVDEDKEITGVVIQAFNMTDEQKEAYETSEAKRKAKKVETNGDVDEEPGA